MFIRKIQGTLHHQRGQGAMRIFTREPSQSLLIGDCISITVVEIRGAQVRIGFKAPSDTRIQRQEVIGRANRAPAKGETSQ
jgi:carbon storage regulator